MKLTTYMKPLLLLLLVCSVVLPGCIKEVTPSYMNEGTIKGSNPFIQKRCGGEYWITINGIDSSKITTFNTLPVGSKIDISTANLPMSVRLNWHWVPLDTCGLIIIDEIEQIK